MKFFVFLSPVIFLIAASDLSAAGNRPIRVEAELIHLRGRRHQVRVISTLPTGGFSKRAATARRIACPGDCRPHLRVDAPIKAPAAGAIVAQVLTQVRHRKNIRIPKNWKAILAVKIDGKTARRLRLREKDARNSKNPARFRF